MKPSERIEKIHRQKMRYEADDFDRTKRLVESIIEYLDEEYEKSNPFNLFKEKE